MTIQQEQLLRQQMLRQEMDQKTGVRMDKDQAAAYQAYIQQLKASGHQVPPATSGTPTTGASSSTSASGGLKQEPTLNLYGYQPFPHMYISQDKLYSHMKDEKQGIKDEKIAPPQQPPPAHQGHSPKGPHHGLGEHPGKSVIVDSRTKEEPRDPRYPQPAHEGQRGHHGLPPAMHSHHQGSITMGSPKPHLKAGGQEPRPAHTGHPGQLPSAVKARTQSPLHVASPQQLSKAVIQPMELQKPGEPRQPAPAHQDHKSPAPSTGTPPHAHGGSAPSNAHSAAIAQPAMSMASSAAYSYNLIQQGLVPNPIYQQAATALGAQQGGKPGQPAPAHGAPSQPAGAQSTSGGPGAVAGQKRRNSKDLTPAEHAQKKPKSGVPPQNTHHGMTPAGPIIPITTAPVPTNSHPYTIPTSHAQMVPGGQGPQAGQGAPVSTSGATAASTSPSAQATSPSAGGKGGQYGTSSGFMDSFRTFVENTVQSAFFSSSDTPDANKQHPKGRHKEEVMGHQGPAPAVAGGPPGARPGVSAPPGGQPPQQQQAQYPPSTLPSTYNTPPQQLPPTTNTHPTVTAPPAGPAGPSTAQQLPAQQQQQQRVPQQQQQPAVATSSSAAPQHVQQQQQQSAATTLQQNTQQPVVTQQPVQQPQQQPVPVPTTQQSQVLQAQQPQQGVIQQLPPASAVPTGLPPGSVPGSCPLPPHLTTNVARVPPSSSPGGASVSSTSSIMETINRVANGFMDTDSDTLSAPSPPPHVKGGESASPSPLKSSNHTKGFKKAWLQRYSDEDKDQKDKKPGSSFSSTSDSKSDAGADCYTFTGTEEEKLPPKLTPRDLISKEIMDESTTSASETESQVRVMKTSIKCNTFGHQIISLIFHDNSQIS